VLTSIFCARVLAEGAGSWPFDGASRLAPTEWAGQDAPTETD